jgi:ribosomal protein L19
MNRDPPDNELHYKRVQVTEARLDLPNLQNGDEVEVEVLVKALIKFTYY